MEFCKQNSQSVAGAGCIVSSQKEPMVVVWFSFGLVLVRVLVCFWFYFSFRNGGVEKATYPHGRVASEFINI